MSRLPLVAVVGRPNVGKSTLVNRIVGRRLAVVEAKAGVTRDRKEIPARWNERDFIVVDTGGWELTPSDDLVADIRGQAEIAIAAADVIVFV
ncbi:MAG: 50S ribosome-binding GTPase, partial [Acidimicrobiia bacterium]|nr:50S ribosome-binding GTPase [Acidimicrobiia bacterium]